MFAQKLGVRSHQQWSKEDRVGILDPVRSSRIQEDTPPCSSIIVPAMAQSVIGSKRRHIAIYSHDIMGLGDTRRNMLIAQILADSPLQVDILIISGLWEANEFPLSPNVHCLTLPALYRTAEGQYQARRLNISLKDLTRLRSKLIQAALEGFEPDVLIVDKAPQGVMLELDATLKFLRTQGRTRCILGLHDALDAPVAPQCDWNRSANEETIRNYYDAVWIYGDPTNTAYAYRFSHDIAAKIRYTGYLDRRSWIQYAAAKSIEAPLDLDLPPGELVLCMAGDGQDGADLATAFAQAEMPPETNGVILTGPLMTSEQRQRLHKFAAKHPRLQVLDDMTEPTLLLERADRVISMGGYDTTCEMLSFKKRALIVPREPFQKEQQIQIEHWRRLGLLDLLQPQEVSLQTLTTWLTQKRLTAKVHDSPGLNVLDRLPQLMEEILNQDPSG